MATKKALVAGMAGQDSSYLAEVLPGKGCDTTSQWNPVGMSSRPSPCPLPTLWGEGGRRPGEGNVLIASVNWYEVHGIVRQTSTCNPGRLDAVWSALHEQAVLAGTKPALPP